MQSKSFAVSKRTRKNRASLASQAETWLVVQRMTAMEEAKQQQLTLEEALAFLEETPSQLDLPLDHFDLDALLLLQSPGEPSAVDGGLQQPIASNEPCLVLAKPVRKRKVYERRDPRKEIAGLQDQVLRLSKQLSVLQRRHHSPANRVVAYTSTRGRTKQSHITRQTPAQLEWIEKALSEFERREQSEQTNKTLKDALVKQIRVSGALKSLLDQERAMQNFDTAPDNEHVQHQPAPNENAQFFPVLYHYLEALYYSTGLIMDKISRVSTSFMSSARHVQHDPGLGLVVELTTITPLKCDLHMFEKLLWNRVLTGSVTRHCQQFKGDVGDERAQQIDSVEKHVKMVLSHSELGKVVLNGVSISRKFVEANRVVMVLTSRTCSTKYDVELRGDSWLILSNSNQSSASEPSTTLFQCFYRIYAGRGTSKKSDEAHKFQEFVVRAGSEKMEEHQLQVQKVLMDEFGTNQTCLLQKVQGS